MDTLIELSELKRAANLEKSRRSFWHFCKTLAPDFYKESRPHLRLLCDSLQALYEGRIQKENEGDEWQVLTLKNPDWNTCKKLMINMPPQHGKSRTLVNFNAWIFGKNVNEKIISISYNDKIASDFGRYTRDLIAGEKNTADEIIYRDIFPSTKIKQGNASFERWALERQHFSFISAGIGGSLTSKGGTVRIIDDPIKDSKQALNETELENIWSWYTSTFLSRVSAKGGEPIDIINMTRWSEKDLCGRLLKDKKEAAEWFVIKMQAYDKKRDRMLCDELLSKKAYGQRRRLTVKGSTQRSIFNANYHQIAMDAKGKLFPAEKLNYFKPDPVLEKEFELTLAYGDVADQGDDFFSFPIGKNIGKKIYITSVIFNDEGHSTTEPLCSKACIDHKVVSVRMEANAMGNIYCDNVANITPGVNFFKSNSDSNKHSRILGDESFILQNVYFLHEDYWHLVPGYAEFMENVTGYLRKGKVAHDDGPDSVQGLCDFFRRTLSHWD